MPNGCPFEIHFVYDRKLTSFVITRCNTSHNHPIGDAIAKHYSGNRRLTPDKAAEALTLIDVGGSTTLVHNYLEHKTGKLVTNQDIHNLKCKVSTTEDCVYTKLLHY